MKTIFCDADVEVDPIPLILCFALEIGISKASHMSSQNILKIEDGDDVSSSALLTL